MSGLSLNGYSTGTYIMAQIMIRAPLYMVPRFGNSNLGHLPNSDLEPREGEPTRPHRDYQGPLGAMLIRNSSARRPF